MPQLILATAAAFGLIAVALGAFAAHGLKHKLADNLLSAFQTGVEYQMYHALALLALAILVKLTPGNWLTASAGLFILGTLLFSGSLYALALTGARWLGPITPIGGLCFMLGWICLFIAAFKHLK
ncbi:DUF423 domain-containing protein [Gilvimarinus agarilyticus]|uniref:DUF423 domain-containing protein n=1 Tax=unclassified Gilvimarinus TaxID=2642066 RepID=UPI001C09B9AB|nr:MULTISPECIES: DUF423 domain-containing protein [unclassified Gilvimarinus]MBU2884412.1 DUF423 domain-containing protein [Gilvimarinus agarilyticus]MDO6569548.1 DUF423 domain-containing protein [Gilvimarinus sp. 2_MG-2023]MDO6748127.1 DUF423 domain-containing protein [Gilvimarinus sp. 1_MG-2023]